ncbi:MAG TPA: TonB family protein [Blastocatellia bacterium]|jgi:protein TonB|nr:TonB family protein [Blastocatellia bacterium]
MTNLKLFAITSVLCVWMAGAPQIDSFEKQALSLVREMPASALDAELPSRSFASWFEQITGPKSGVVWQLTECGEPIAAPDKTRQDLPACAEVNANLPDGRKVFVAIIVGTFKKGLTGKPELFRAVIEQNEQFYQANRLSDLAEMLRAPDSFSDSLPNKRPAIKTKNQIVNPPATNVDPVQTVALSQYPSPPSPIVPGVQGHVETPPAAPPPPLPQEPEKVSEDVLQGRAITRVNPVYPPSARKMNATGTVGVEVTISEKGLVVEATAISGHFALRSAAVEAARKWVFSPTIFSGAPVRIKGVLTFTFGPGAK